MFVKESQALDRPQLKWLLAILLLILVVAIVIVALSLKRERTTSQETKKMPGQEDTIATRAETQQQLSQETISVESASKVSDLSAPKPPEEKSKSTTQVPKEEGGNGGSKQNTLQEMQENTQRIR